MLFAFKELEDSFPPKPWALTSQNSNNGIFNTLFPVMLGTIIKNQTHFSTGLPASATALLPPQDQLPVLLLHFCLYGPMVNQMRKII